MRKRIILSITVTLISILTAIFAFVPAKQETDPFLCEWMKYVEDDTKITQLSIPGSHDSGAIHSIADVAGKCQDLSVFEQLNIGVRFFDIRLQLVNDTLKVVHSFVDQAMPFKYVMQDFSDFITKHSTEMLIVSIKEDADSKNSNKSFSESVIEELNNYKDVIDFSSQLPETLKEARGKIYILSRFNTEIGINAYYGWQDSTTFELDNMIIQDNYSIDDVEVKKTDILNTIASCTLTPDKLHINFTSCYLNDSFPPTYAGTTANTINPWFINYLHLHSEPTGIIVSDFVTDELCRIICQRNYLWKSLYTY